MSFAVGTINLPAATTGNRSVTGVTPDNGPWKAVFLWYAGRSETTDASGEQTIRNGAGAATSTSARWAVASEDIHAAGTTASRHVQTSSSCLTFISSSVVDAVVDFVSFNSDGFTVNITDALTAAHEVSYMLFGGANLVARAGREQLIAALGNGDYTTAGFQAGFGLFAFMGSASLDLVENGNIFSIGAATNFNQAVLANWAFTAVGTSSTVSYCFGGPANNSSFEVMANVGQVRPAVSGRSSFVEFISNGFTLNRLEGTGASYCFYLLLQNAVYSVGDFLTATDTNAFTEAHGLGQTPQAALFFSANRAASTQDATTGAYEWSIGAFDGTNLTAQYARSKDANSGSDCFVGVSHDQCYLNADDSATMALEGEGHVNSFDDTNINLQMTDADPVASFVWYAAFGDAPPIVPVLGETVGSAAMIGRACRGVYG